MSRRDELPGFGPARPRPRRAWMTGRMAFGLVLLALGLLWTFDNLDLVEAERITRWWPALLLAWGLSRILGLFGRPRLLSGLVWSAIGGWLLLRVTGVVDRDLLEFWPLALIVVGSVIVYRAVRGRSPAADEDDAPQLSAFACLGGLERKVISAGFRGGEVSAVMGGAVIDLRPSRLENGRAVIDVLALFGGIDLVVPEGWRIRSDVAAVLGGFDDKTLPPDVPQAPTLIVRGIVALGGIDVKHEADSDRARRRRAARLAPDRWHGDAAAERRE